MWCTQVLRHDIGEKKKVGTVSEAFPHLVLDNFTSKLGQRVANILKYLFPCPKVRSLFARRLGFTARIRAGGLCASPLGSMHLLAFVLVESECFITSIPG